MQPPKPKKTPPSGRPLRSGDAATDDESQWSSHAPAVVQPDLLDVAVPESQRVRLLRTADDKPTAPRLQDLFPRETRPIDHVVAFWDPAGVWSPGTLAELQGPGVGELSSTRLVHADTSRTFAEIHHLTVPTVGGELCALLHVAASPAEAASADVALMLLERSDHAIVLTSASGDQRDVPRRLNDFCRQATWRGPTLQFLTPLDKPSRADRLRRANWHRSVRMQVIEWSAVSEPGWLVQLLDRVAEGVAFEGLERPAQTPSVRVLVPAPDDSYHLVAPPPRPLGATPRRLVPPEPAPVRPSIESCEQALAIAALSPGFAGSAVIDAFAELSLAVRGHRHQTEAGVASALQMWTSYADDTSATPVNELVWTIGAIHHIVVPVESQPGLLVLSMIDREFGDLPRARWQLAVARNEFA